MIIKSYPSNADFESLIRLETELSTYANQIDYSSVVVNKPWGYEYLWYQNVYVAIWILYLKANQSTSLHCHWHKRTSLIVLDGEAICTTLKRPYHLNVLEAIVLEPCTFHATQAISEAGAFFLELEAPPMKGDLVRLRDDFGRQAMAYEGSSQLSTSFDRYHYQPLQVDYLAASQKFCSVRLSAFSISDRVQLEEVLSTSSLVIPLQRLFTHTGEVLVDVGETCCKQTLDCTQVPSTFPPLEILTITKQS